MEETCQYVEDPIMEINQIIDLEKEQSVELRFKVRKSQRERTENAVRSFAASFAEHENISMSGRMGRILDKLEELSAGV